MKIGIDIRDLRISQTGAKTYLTELIRAWQALPAAHIVLLDAPHTVYTGTNKWLKIREHARFFWWKQFQLPRLAIKNHCTHLFCSDFFLPYRKKWGAIDLKTMAVLHDAFFWESPEHYNPLWLCLFRWVGVPAAKKANLLIVPTNYAKQRLLQVENFEPAKLWVVPEAAQTLPLVTNPQGQLASIDPSLVGVHYFLHVGVWEKRKNLVTLIEAFARVHKKNTKLKLVLVGHSPVKDNLNDEPAILAAIDRFACKGAIIRLGYLAPSQLAVIYQSAFAYLFPSLNEGFGLPVLEAFTAGIPLVCSNNSALPEVAGNAALYFDPTNASALAACMQQLIEDPALQQALIEKGKERLTHFSWSETAVAINAAAAIL